MQQCETQCKVDCDDAIPLTPKCTTCAAKRQTCIANCDKKCQPGPPVAVSPRYLIIAIIYAPPGCTSSSASKCAGVSKVDYGNGSSNGTKNSTNSSFKAGFDVSADSKLSGGVGWSVNTGFQLTQTDSSTESLTKTQTNDIAVNGNEDGIDHGQDQFILLLNPVVYVQQQQSNVTWNLSHSGGSADIYTLYVSWLKNPSSMPANVAAQLQQLGFTNSDYQTILAQDPFANGPAAIDPNRYTVTMWTFPYEPPLQATDCNNGVCACTSFSDTIKNDLQNEVSASYQNQYSVGLTSTLGLTDLISLKSTASFTWTNGAATTNTTGSSQSAAMTVVCPSIVYTGPTLMQVYWDALYGSFMFVPFDLTNTVVMQKGQVTNASGKAVRGQLVNLAFGGKTYHTFTDNLGEFKFVIASAKASSAPATGLISIRGLQKTVTLRSAVPTQISVP